MAAAPFPHAMCHEPRDVRLVLSIHLAGMTPKPSYFKSAIVMLEFLDTESHSYHTECAGLLYCIKVKVL